MPDFYADKYFNGRYFAPRYWQSSDGSGATIGEMVATLSGASSVSGTLEAVSRPVETRRTGGGFVYRKRRERVFRVLANDREYPERRKRTLELLKAFFEPEAKPEAKGTPVTQPALPDIDVMVYAARLQAILERVEAVERGRRQRKIDALIAQALSIIEEFEQDEDDADFLMMAA
jgi:hypothetical protein